MARVLMNAGKTPLEALKIFREHFAVIRELEIGAPLFKGAGQAPAKAAKALNEG